MGLSGIHTRTWTLFVFLSWLHLEQVRAKPQYVVAIPVILEAGAETKFCASLLQPNETLVMTVTLRSQEMYTTLLKKISNTEFHNCTQFQVPLVDNNMVQQFEVEVQSDTFYSKEIRKVLIKVYQPVTFVQTDKPMYLPGQTVHFRVITLDTHLRPVHQPYDIIEIEDPKGNRIGQWLNEISSGTILQHSYSLNSEAHEGSYKVIVTINGKKIYHSFKVEKYVLPKFDVKINALDQISLAQTEVTAYVCGTYTYGQPVSGTAELMICRPGRRSNPHVCQTKIQQTNQKGCAPFIFKMSTFTQSSVNNLDITHLLEDKLFLNAKLKENGTGVSISKEKTTVLSYVAGTLTFIDTPNFYKEGSIVEGKVKAVDYNNAPIPNREVCLVYVERFFVLLETIITDMNGIAAFSLNTTNSRGNIKITAGLTKTQQISYRKLHYKVAVHTLSFNPSSSRVEPVSRLEVKKKNEQLRCDSEEIIIIQYTIAGQIDQHSVDVVYLVLARGAIVMHGFEKIDVQNQQVKSGEVSFKVRVSPEMAPDIHIIAYAVLHSESVITHSADFSTEKCFSHKVSLEFSPSSAVPGEDTTLQLTAQPDSLCGMNIVDQSVLIREPGKTLNEDRIYDLLPIKKISSVPPEAADLYTCFNSLQLKIATNLLTSCVRVQRRKIHIPRVPKFLKYRGRPFLGKQSSRYNLRYSDYEERGFYSTNPKSLSIETYPETSPPPPPPPPPPIETIRTFFPETWIWDLVEIGESGKKDVSLTVPDTITTWETEAFCLSPQGFGLAPRKIFTVFQPFFLELTMPYSIIRGEQFELKATVFNYLTSCIMINVTPASSSDYSLSYLSSDQYTSCLCGSETKTLSWNMAPLALGVVNATVRAEAVGSQTLCDNEIVSVPERGRIDVVTKSLIVKAEGTEITKAYNWLLCPKGDTLTEEAEIRLPHNVIHGSSRASLSVLGDILGRALKNLDGLLKMPYGCGEQNMALLAPNIYILQYLKGTQQLTPAIIEKATNFLTSGYQRQLNYKHDDGSYSTFGSGPGNTWLTAFVLRSFVKAQSFIYIEPTKIEQSKTWLISLQKQNGCFQSSGKLLNNRMKGGVSDEVTLSTYITAAFLEMSESSHVVMKSLSCLKESLGDLSNTYTTALLAYVFTLAGDMETRAQLLQHLDTVSVTDGGLLYWSQTVRETSASLSVEISSYVLLAKLSASPTVEDMGYASRIVRWLTKQQNSYGGFSSTQDTVVALQALALYSTLVFSPEGSSTVTVQSPSGQLTFDVNQDNKLLYQETLLQDVTGKYRLEVTGTACASVQVSLLYNIPIPTDVTTLSVEAQPECSYKSDGPKLTLKLKSLYSGAEQSTNMVILDIKILSGFVPDLESLKMLKGGQLVDRVEQKDDHVLVYLRELLQHVAINHSLELIQELPVKNLKPAVVKIYDYYQPSDQAETEYMYDCAAA
ncbi:alpha-2-macroglobulin-like [Parambassis ranga]|uniref:Alpha-2-macroglobulin-like n=1 Tax=Parambassis ranga TaxID=210632 RepID=A0A6P7JCV3_9TELE|nr:alpha-2-macroglobulin-like [Parambassis ranga]